jgi:ketosteroid isomerase-like protein
VTASANLDFVRSIFAAHERGDFSSAEWAHPEIEYVVPEGPEPGSWKGLAGMAEAARQRLNTWEAYRIEVDEYRELDGERVLVLIRRSGRGKLSGLQLGQIGTKGAHLFNIRDGKVRRLVAYADRQRALADVGLDSEGGFP